MSREPVSAARATLRRLRWLLAVVFTVINAVGLLVFAWLAVRSDAESGRRQLDGELERTTLAAIQKIAYSGGAVSLDGLTGSGLSRGDTSFAVLPGTAAPFLGLQSGTGISASLANLSQVATRAVRSNRVVASDAMAGGHHVRILADPFHLTKPAAIGAVVATVDAGPEVSRHHRVLGLTAAGCTILIGGLAAAGYLVAGRAMRPAANTLEQQELLLAESAHDLRTPVAALRALAETALLNPSQSAELLPRTVYLSHRMGNIINDLLTRARLAAGVEQLNLQQVRLDQLVAGVVDSTPTAGGRITLAAAETTVLADPALIQRAVGNLLDNALRHGRIGDQPATIAVSVVDGRVSVADRGPGLHEPLKATPFNRSGSSTTGLGLSIVRWIAEAHGGELRVHNAPTGGAVFELVLAKP